MNQEETKNEVVSEVPEQEGISLKDIFYIVRKHIIAILIAVIGGTVVGLAGAIVKDKVRPSYSASATMLVSTDQGSIGSGSTSTQQYQYSTYIKETMMEFIKDNVVMDMVQEKFTYKTVAQIKSSLSISNSTDSLIFTLKYTDRDPEVAVDVVNAVCDCTIAAANSGTEQNPTYKLLYGNIANLSKATGSTKKSSKRTYTLIGLAAGAVIAIAYVFIREYFDNSFKSSEEIERYLNLPVIAAVPEYELSKDDEHPNDAKGGK